MKSCFLPAGFRLLLTLLWLGYGLPATGAAEDDKPTAAAPTAAAPAAKETAAKLVVDSIMYQDPLLEMAGHTLKFARDLKEVWLQALEREEAETRRMAIETISIAIEKGMTGLDSTIPTITKLLQDRDPLVQQAAARTLINLQAKSAAGEMAAAASAHGQALKQVVEPALARWQDKTLRDDWLARLSRPETPRVLLLVAIDALGQLREPAAVEPLRKLVVDGNEDLDVRGAAARAVGQIVDTGMTDVATQLMASKHRPEFLGRLLALRLILRHQGESTVQQLQTLAVDPEPSIATAALGRLDQLQAAAALAIAQKSLGNADAGVRKLAAELVARPHDANSVRLLGPLLSDRNPTIRQFVASTLARDGATESLRDIVIEQAIAALRADAWRGQEQAALVLGTLDHEPAAGRLVELLKSQRGEVAIASAWALRKLRVPETLAPMLAHAEVLYRGMTAPNPPAWGGSQGSQIFQTFGELRYREAEPLMRQFVPKNLSLSGEMRGAACWALAWLHEGEASSDLVGLFAARLADAGTTPPEVHHVRLMSAVGLGRLKAASQVELLRKFADQDGEYSEIGLACRWSVELLSDYRYPPKKPRTLNVSGWFLQPLPRALPESESDAKPEGTSAGSSNTQP
ncbi:MAG: HEAT repeat domain-containing protein [Planctomycetota bacterium]